MGKKETPRISPWGMWIGLGLVAPSTMQIGSNLIGVSEVVVVPDIVHAFVKAFDGVLHLDPARIFREQHGDLFLQGFDFVFDFLDTINVVGFSHRE